MEDLQYFYKLEKDFKLLDEFNNFISHTYTNGTKQNNFEQKKSKHHFNPIKDLNEEQFCQKYHFTKENMSKIIEMIGDDLEIDSNNCGNTKNQVSGELQVMIAIRSWILQEHPEITASIHGISYETLQKICKRVAAAFAMRASRFIRMPATLSEKEQVTSSFRALASMPQIIGTVVHRTVRVIESTTDKKEGFIYIQFICDASLKIRDIDCKYQKDFKEEYFSKMFSKSRIKERMEQNEFRGRFLLGNSQINCSNALLTPLLLPRNEKETSYNAAHYTTYRPAVNCMQLFSQRFGIIESEFHGSLNTAKNTIITLALLHNLSLEWGDPSIQLAFNKYSNHPMPYEIYKCENEDCKIQNKTFQQDFIKHNF